MTKRNLTERQRFELYVSTTVGPCPRMFVGKSGTKKGYGNFKSPTSGSKLAHRVAYRLYKGSIDPDLDVLHSCDIRRCVTEEHLRQGTNLENVQDALDRDRYSHGSPEHFAAVLRAEDQPNSKLRNATIFSIIKDRKNRIQVNTLSTKYKVSRKVIGDILHGRAYRSVTRFSCCTHGAGGRSAVCTNIRNFSEEVGA